MINIRYNNSENNHPKYKEIKEKFPIIQQIKTVEDKKLNKLNTQNREKELTNFNIYLQDCNDLFVILFLILFHIQTSNPPYIIKNKENIFLWDLDFFTDIEWIQEKYKIHEKISMDTIELLEEILNKLSTINKHKFWKNINTLLNEKLKYPDVTNFKEQFIYSASYILRDSKIKNKLRDYYNIRNNIGIKVYIKETWSSYRPLPDNNTIISINENLSNQFISLKPYLIKNGGDISYENISSIHSIEKASIVPKYKFFDIPYSDILKNESYERLFNYCVHLHGLSEPKPILNLLINNFINTIDDSSIIENMIIPAGWNKDKKELDYINFTKLKQIFIIELTDYFKKKNINESPLIDTYIHIHFNNWNGMLLNGHSKRNYSYIPPIVYPNDSFEVLQKYKPKEKENKHDVDPPVNIIKALFNKYCYNEYGDFNERYNIDHFILNLLADPSIERDASCFKKIPETKENFIKLLKYKIIKNSLVLNNSTIEQYNIEKRLNNFIQINKLLHDNTENTYDIFYNLNNLINVEKNMLEKEYRNIFNSIVIYNNDIIDKISNFINTSYHNEFIDSSHINRLSTKSLNGFNIILNKFIQESKVLDNSIYTIKFILNRLSIDSNNKEILFHDHIPPQWKMSTTNEKNLQEYINNNELLYHNDIFVDKQFITEEGFYKYKKEKKHTLCIKGIATYINKFYTSGIENVNGDDNTYFTDNYNMIFKQFIFLFIFSKLIDYIDYLKDNESIISREANDLFSALEEKDRTENNEIIKTCTHLTFDLLLNSIDEHFDTSWINQSELLPEKLSRQKEQEKQSIINDLESKTSDDRLVTTELQRIGVISWYKDKSSENLQNIKTQDYKNQTNNERIDRLKEVFNDNPNMLELMERNNQTITIPDNEEQHIDEGYNPIDHDQEHQEGDDDPDDSGNYKEL